MTAHGWLAVSDNALTTTHRHFLETLKPTFVCGDFIFVHAGLRPLVPIEQQEEDDLLWIRDDFLLWDREFEKIVVHGHTPVREPDIRSNRINIDTGAFATGRLTCLTIEGAEIAPSSTYGNGCVTCPILEYQTADQMIYRNPNELEL